jgi:type IV pilus assembly protein PilV
MRLRHDRPRRASGFTLVEVLVAVVVLCIGLLGIAKMSLISVQSNNSAYMRSQAAILIQEIIDNMHSNRSAAIAGSYSINVGVTAPNPGIVPTSTTVAIGTSAAAYDLSQWKTRLAAALPLGDGGIAVATSVVNGQSETTAVVTVQWVDSVAQAALGTTPTPNQSLTVETLL